MASSGARKLGELGWTQPWRPGINEPVFGVEGAKKTLLGKRHGEMPWSESIL